MRCFYVVNVSVVNCKQVTTVIKTVQFLPSSIVAEPESRHCHPKKVYNNDKNAIINTEILKIRLTI